MKILRQRYRYIILAFIIILAIAILFTHSTCQSSVIKDENFEIVHAYEMWENMNLNKIAFNQPVIVAIVDTGINFNHSELKASLWSNKGEIINGYDDDENGYIDDIHGWNFCTQTGEINHYVEAVSENNHGTACAGIIVAKGEEYIGIANDINVDIMSLKVLDGYNGNKGNMKDVINAIKYAENMGAKICNLSWSTIYYNHELYDAINNSSMIFIVSAGNNLPCGLNIDKTPIYPASFDCENIIVVGGINGDGYYSQISNYGLRSVDILAPCENVVSTSADGKHFIGDGTSMAVPFVTAAVTIIYSKYPDIEPKEVRNIVQCTGDIADHVGNISQDIRRLNLLNLWKYLYEED